MERTVEIARPVAEIYAFLCDATRLTEWRHGLLAVERISPPGSLDGALYRETIATPLGPQTVIVELGAVPMRELSFKVVAGPIRPHGRMTLRPAGFVVELRYETHVGPVAGFPTPVDGFVRKQLAENVEKSLANLKRILDPGSSNVST